MGLWLKPSSCICFCFAVVWMVFVLFCCKICPVAIYTVLCDTFFCYFVANNALSIWRKTKPKFFLWRKSDKYDVWMEVSEIPSNWPYYLFHDLCEFSTLSCPLSDYDRQMHIVFVLSSHSSKCTTPKKYFFVQRQLIWQ